MINNVESKKIPVELYGDDLALFEVLEAKIRTPGMRKSEKSKKIIQMAIFALECKFNEFSDQSGHRFPGFESFQRFLGMSPSYPVPEQKEQDSTDLASESVGNGTVAGSIENPDEFQDEYSAVGSLSKSGSKNNELI